MPDINFDPLIERFQKNIYGSVKGEIRERLIKHHFIENLPIVDSPALQCADIGGGLGQFTHWFLSHGHSVDYFDVSEKMMHEAQTHLPPEHASKASFTCGPFQHMPHKQYDLVNCQAVLEWLEQPTDGLIKLGEMVKPGGYLTVLFYNKTSIILRNLIRGNLNAAFGDVSGDGNGLTPINPLLLDDILLTLSQQNLTLKHWFGVRTFTDYQDKKTQRRLGAETLYKHELSLSTEEPYRSLARYVGVICQKPLK